jgi:RHS repeat-associated protein
MVRGPLDGMIHTDHLGTPHKMTDANQAVVWSAYYKPFGAATVTVSTITNNLRFPGQYFDAETGLYQNGFRDYNSVIGRYIEPDPLLADAFVGSFFARILKAYSYVEDNPVKLVDKDGLSDTRVSGSGYGWEAMLLLGGGQGSSQCCDGKNLWSVRYFKICGGLGAIASAGGSVTIGDNKNCPNGYAGATLEAAFGPVSGVNTLGSNWSDLGGGGGWGAKIFVLCISKFTQPPAIIGQCSCR